MTGQEYKLADDMVILSTADLYGTIIDYNLGFKEASGYSDAELKGKPHNILRHPDMPKEAYEDFWKTIQAGRPWFGIVKNKRKNGGFYWVSANASPIIKQGKITGYLSVRYPASREQISQAEALYSAVKSGKKSFPKTKINNSNKCTLALAFTSLLAFVPMAASFLEFSIPSFAEGALYLLGFSAWALIVTKLYKSNFIPADLKTGAEELSNGQYRNRIDNNSQWGMTLNMIRSRVGDAAAKHYDQIREAKIVDTAVDLASSNMMLVDKSFDIVNINRSLQNWLTKHEALLQEQLENFTDSNLIGTNLQNFVENLPYQTLEDPKQTTSFVTEIKLAKLILRLTITPIELEGQRLGYVVEWLDRTEEVLIIDDISRVVDAMKAGKLSPRIEVNATGTFLAIKTNLNEYLDIVEEVINGVTGIVNAQSKGDLTQQFVGSFQGQLEELKDALNNSSSSLNNTIIQAMTAAEMINKNADDIAQGAINLNNRVQEQAVALEETTASMNEMSQSVKANTQNAHEANSLVDSVEKKVVAGENVMTQTIGAMNAIEESSRKIAEIVSLIDSIAFQTNLLALNAAVEAARAGEQGRGFAVVAGEVRALAQKSADAAKDIRVLIDESVQRVSQGATLAAESGQTLQEIRTSIHSVIEVISNIVKASSEQASGISQIHLAVRQLEEVTQRNAALSEQTTDATEQMKNQADILAKDMAFFNTKADNSRALALK